MLNLTNTNTIEFLNKLYKQKNRNVYMSATCFDLSGEPLETIEGLITGGSINLDGASSVQRSCSLTAVIDKTNYFIQNTHWTLSTKLSLSIGIENFIDSNYNQIIWFDLGQFYLANFSFQEGLNSYSVSMSCKDKMCMLNGELGGVFTAPTTRLDVYDIIDDDGNLVETVTLTIQEIIRNLVQAYSREPFYNIIIKDLDIEGQELIDYIGTEDLFLFKNSQQEIVNWTTDVDQQIYFNGQIVQINDNNIQYEKVAHMGNILNNKTIIPSTIFLLKDGQPQEEPYTIVKISYGETIGYKSIPLTYPQELMANMGDTVTSILDKLITFLGHYEYFFNEKGQFIFQKKQEVLSTDDVVLSNTDLKVKIIEPLALASAKTYDFYMGDLVTQYSETFNLAKVKNDFVAKGKRGETPIMARIGISEKPVSYITSTGEEFSTLTSKEQYYDWREVLYQMARDFAKYNQTPNFFQKLQINNPWCKRGQTGYETYYTDILSFWRDLYNPNPPPHYNQVGFNEVDHAIDDIYVYNYTKAADTDEQSMAFSRSDLYIPKVYENTQYLQRWIDTVNFFDVLEGDSPAAIADKLYYYNEKNALTKIIDSLDFYLSDYKIGTNETLGQVEAAKYPYELIQPNEIEHIYLSNSLTGAKYKYHDYFAAGVCNTIDLKDFDSNTSQCFYIVRSIKKEDGTSETQYLPVEEILIERPTKPLVIWQYYNHQLLTLDTINTIASAETLHFSKLKIRLANAVTYQYLQDGDYFAIEGYIEPANKYIWYKQGKNFEFYVDKILKYEEDRTQNIYSKYNTYFNIASSKEPNYQPALMIINLDKDAIYIEEYNDAVSASTHALVRDKIDLPSEFYIKTNTYVALTNDLPLYNMYVSPITNTLQQNVLAKTLDLYGNIHCQHIDAIALTLIEYFEKYYDYLLHQGNDYSQCWNKVIYEDFSKARFWLDMIEPKGEISKYAIHKIGDRISTEQNDLANAINFGKIPNFIWVQELPSADQRKGGYTYIKINETMFESFRRSTIGVSCQDMLNTQLTNFALLTSSVNITCLPIYHLVPNTYVRLYHDVLGTYDKYEINKITLPLTHNGLMQISANKILKNDFIQ